MSSHWVPRTVRMRRTRLLVTSVIVTVTAMLALATPVAAKPHQGTVDVLDASKRVNGYTAAKLLGEEFRQLLELPVEENPLAGNGDNCLSAGHRDKVLILFTVPEPADPAECTIPPGTPVFFSSFFGECSNVEGPPFFGATATEQRKCALDFLRANPIDKILVSIDEGTPVNIGVRRYLAVAKQGTVQLPESNILGAPDPGEATFVVAAYSALLRSLPRGTHTINVEVVGGPFAGTNRAVVHVSGHKS